MVLRCLLNECVNIFIVVGEAGEFVDRSLDSSSSISRPAVMHKGSSPRWYDISSS